VGNQGCRVHPARVGIAPVGIAPVDIAPVTGRIPGAAVGFPAAAALGDMSPMPSERRTRAVSRSIPLRPSRAQRGEPTPEPTVAAAAKARQRTLPAPELSRPLRTRLT
jgi:hypothetical protein